MPTIKSSLYKNWAKKNTCKKFVLYCEASVIQRLHAGTEVYNVMCDNPGFEGTVCSYEYEYNDSNSMT